jgi:hypothetical protein
MSAIDGFHDDPSGCESTDTTSEPRITLGVLMFATIAVPGVSLRYFDPETAAKLLTTMIPFLLVAISRTSIRSYTVYDSER